MPDALAALGLTRPIRHIAVAGQDGWAIVFPPTNNVLKKAVEKGFPTASLVKRRIVDTNALHFWFVPHEDGLATRLQAFAEKEKFEFTSDAARELRRLLADTEASRALAGQTEPTKEILVPDFVVPLRAYQLAALEYGEKKNAIYVMDEPGVGKTPTAIGWVHWRNLYPVIVVCPANARTQWAEEFVHFLGDAVKVQVLPPTPRGEQHALSDWVRAPGKRAVITSYNALHDWLPFLRNIPWGAVVGDEYHYIKKFSARRTRDMIELMEGIPHRAALSGTPQTKTTQDFVSQLKGLGVLEFFKGYRALEGSENEADQLAFNRRLAEVCAIRRRKEDVLAQLPELNIMWSAIDLEDAAQRKYEKAEDEFADEAERATDVKLPMGTLRRVLGESKVEPILEWLKPRWSTEMTPIIFCYHHSVLDTIGAALEADGIHTVRFDGRMTPAQKDAAVKRFQQGNGRAMVAQLEAAGVALNLQRADTVVFTELDWLPHNHTQAYSRAHRSGSKHERVDVHYLHAPGTLDEDLRAILEQRSRSIGVVVDGKSFDPSAVLAKFWERRGKR